MPVFGKRQAIDAAATASAVKKSKDENLRRQLNQILQAKRQLTIQMQHWERIRAITKDPGEIASIDRRLHQMRMDFLAFSTDKF
ncbi:hypothetical protein [Alphabaculovirus myunipunctae]|uniref:Uncharacterized protein n=1 Tax=Mythimna unipuncta nucleopolyhedrovirus TaxID=447897 RepID=A0A2K9VSH0_9ABAC|nr:hypothetical protein [Mythimna unipuncta nucleopolyhedrovirus]AUV65403.1 hypothetical protein [Mythimna unipuncta nucleopolyhedrovirus]